MANHWLNGLHVANGQQDMVAAHSVGFKCFTFLNGQHNDMLPLLGDTSVLSVMRMYSPGFTTKVPKVLVNSISQFQDVRHVIPWNEANLGYEVGEPDAEQDIQWKLWNYSRLERFWDDFLVEFRASPNTQNKTLHFPAWSPWDNSVGPFWAGADVYDLHLYGSPQEMLSQLDKSLIMIPYERMVFISEWNFRKPWSLIADSEVQEFLNGLSARRRRVLGATAFIWKWYNPDPEHPNLDIEGTRVAEVLGRWRPMPEFAGSFIGLAQQLGTEVVGEPVTEIRYNSVKNEDGSFAPGGDIAVQYTTKGKMEAVKREDGVWLLDLCLCT